MLDTRRLILFLAVLVATTTALALGKISPEVWMALIGGTLVPSPLSDQPLARRLPPVAPRDVRSADQTSPSP